MYTILHNVKYANTQHGESVLIALKITIDASYHEYTSGQNDTITKVYYIFSYQQFIVLFRWVIGITNAIRSLTSLFDNQNNIVLFNIFFLFVIIEYFIITGQLRYN